MFKRLKNILMPHKGNGHHPHIFRKKAVLGTMGIVLVVQLFILAGSILPRLDNQFAAVLPSVVTLLTNNVRADNNLAGLQTNDLLVKAAQAKANDMAAKGYFAHVSPDGSQPWYWIQQAGYEYQYAGENLAVNFTDSEEVVKAWQNSPTHNLNLLGPRYTEIGVAVADGMYEGREVTFVVQMFASPKSESQPVAKATTKPKVEPEAVKLAVAQGDPKSSEVKETSSDVSVLGATTNIIKPPSWINRVLSSSRTYGMYLLAALMFVLIAVMGMGWGKHHRRSLMGGTLAIAVVAGVIYMNRYVVFQKVELPQDTSRAATVILK